MKTIILCFDGTGNDPGDAAPGRRWLGLGPYRDKSISNVLKLHLMLGGTLRGEHRVDGQHGFYYPGVGTYGGAFDRFWNWLRAPAHGDVGTIIKRAMRDLHGAFEPGDRVVMFGFSRGAAIARRFAAVLERSLDALDWPAEPRIAFLGAFDTVAAINGPNFFAENVKPATDVVFENGSVSPLIDQALHLLALDERRIAFMPTLMNRDDRVTEIWLPGAHSDVGGGYRFDGLSDGALTVMLDFMARSTTLGLDLLTPNDIEYTTLFEGREQPIVRANLLHQPNPYAKTHEQGWGTDDTSRLWDRRTPRINVNDRHSMHPPVIHRRVFDRMAVLRDYRPPALLAHMQNPWTGTTPPIRVCEEDGAIGEPVAAESVKSEGYPPPRTLEVGESTTAIVYAALPENPSGVLMGAETNERYALGVDRDQRWFDDTVECSPVGWTTAVLTNPVARTLVRLGERSRRVPTANWAALCGAIGPGSREGFRLLQEDGTALEDFAPPARGELMLFANDVPSKYGNNRGLLEVMITRVR